jgi:cytochrome c oxidase cbb3-type subunit 1
MDSTLLTLLSAFVPSIIGLFAFIWSMRRGLLSENPKAASVIFASGEVGKVDDPALHGDAHDAMQSSALWLLVGSLAGLASSIKLHEPDWMVSQAWMTFGRLCPS